MMWKKLGAIFNVDGHKPWMSSHAALPLAKRLAGDIHRIYFSSRDGGNRSHGAYVDVDLTRPREALRVAETPVLKPGPAGSFDERGVSLSCYGDSGLMYYLGWGAAEGVPFSNQIGAARMREPEFEKLAAPPVLGKCVKEPWTFGYPWVLKMGGVYHMWYETNSFWNREAPERTIFSLRFAESHDGVHWDKTGDDCLPLLGEERHASRPCVLFENGLFKMWYCVNVAGKYRLGYAESRDGRQWTRKDDEVGLLPSGEGWDGEEVCYPYVFDHAGERFMLYNGNSYGKTGFGLAKLKP